MDKQRLLELAGIHHPVIEEARTHARHKQVYMIEGVSRFQHDTYGGEETSADPEFHIGPFHTKSDAQAYVKQMNRVFKQAHAEAWREEHGWHIGGYEDSYGDSYWLDIDIIAVELPDSFMKSLVATAEELAQR